MCGSRYIASMPSSSAPSAKIFVFRSARFIGSMASTVPRQNPLDCFAQGRHARVGLVWDLFIVLIIDQNGRAAPGGPAGLDVPPPVPDHHAGGDVGGGGIPHQSRAW